MTIKHTLILGVAMMTLAVGCRHEADFGISPSRGTTRSLGDVSARQAYATAREIFNQHYSIEAEDATTMLIKSRPKRVENVGNERLLGGSPARQIAWMKIIPEGPRILAQAYVVQQRQGSAANKQMGYAIERENYTGAPGQETPAMVDAATSAEQNEVWIDEKARHDLEADILKQLYDQLHGGM